ncbi:MAG: hypothetical protein COB53_02870 [Elusimicrobia bacterium]|nr:MAG: hypothetical protein COB53_02870 [Elusimicrobiota bacterium]
MPKGTPNFTYIAARSSGGGGLYRSDYHISVIGSSIIEGEGRSAANYCRRYNPDREPKKTNFKGFPTEICGGFPINRENRPDVHQDRISIIDGDFIIAVSYTYNQLADREKYMHIYQQIVGGIEKIQ